MDASFDPVSDAPTPTPRTPLRDIKSVSRVLIAFIARADRLARRLTWLRAIRNRLVGNEFAQTLPTKVTGAPRAVVTLARTSVIGLPIVDELLPAKSNATGMTANGIIVRHDQRARVTARAKGCAVDHHLIRIETTKLLYPSRNSSDIARDAGVDRTDIAHSKSL